MILTKEEYLAKIGKTEEELKAEGLELVYIGKTGYEEDVMEDGWETVFMDPCKDLEFGLGCACSSVPLSSVHDKL